MNTMGISTDPALLQVELSQNLLESPSVSTFMPEEEASIYPLLSSNTNGTITPLTFSHPLTPCIDNDNDSNMSTNLCNEDGKVETSSSSGSSSGIGISVPSDIDASTTLFNKHSYKHLPNNNVIQVRIQRTTPHVSHTKETNAFCRMRTVTGLMGIFLYQKIRLHLCHGIGL